MLTSSALYLLQLLVSAFLAILFLQSGIDKIVDRQGNLSWLSDHFSKSPLAGLVPLLFTILTIIEVASGVLSGIGFLALIFSRNPTIAFYGAIVSAIAILCLFLRMRRKPARSKTSSTPARARRLARDANPRPIRL